MQRIATLSRSRLIAAFIAILIALAFTIWNPAGNYWNGVEDPKAQCEAYDATRLSHNKILDRTIYSHVKLDRLVREPQNTFSNIFYFVAAILVFRTKRLLPCSLAFGLTFLSAGSGIYHASLLPEWRLIDIIGVYQVLTILGLIALLSLRSFNVSVPVGIWLCIAGILSATLAAIWRNDLRLFGIKPLDSTYVVVALVGITLSVLVFQILCDREEKFKRKCLKLSVIFAPTMLAILGGAGDRFGGFLAMPDAAIQGHAVWHTAGAIAATMGFHFFEERKRKYVSSTEEGGIRWRLI